MLISPSLFSYRRGFITLAGGIPSGVWNPTWKHSYHETTPCYPFLTYAFHSAIWASAGTCNKWLTRGSFPGRINDRAPTSSLEVARRREVHCLVSLLREGLLLCMCTYHSCLDGTCFPSKTAIHIFSCKQGQNPRAVLAWPQHVDDSRVGLTGIGVSGIRLVTMKWT